MSKMIDLTGQTFGRLTVRERAENTKDGKASWKCICECGNEITVIGKDLRSGNTKSCGCYSREVASMKAKKHGYSKSRIHNIWLMMKQRCYNPKYPQFKDWGGRGITICDEWLGEHGAENFIKWAKENGYADNLEIDRKNNDGNYCPENCRWATRKEQANNKRCTHLITFNGKTQSIKQWAEEIGINYGTLISRIEDYGWSIEKALTTAVQK